MPDYSRERSREYTGRQADANRSVVSVSSGAIRTSGGWIVPATGVVTDVTLSYYGKTLTLQVPEVQAFVTRYNGAYYILDTIGATDAFMAAHSQEIYDLISVRSEKPPVEIPLDGLSAVILDNPTKNYKALIARGEIINTAYTSTNQRYSQQLGTSSGESERQLNAAYTGSTMSFELQISWATDEHVEAQVGLSRETLLDIASNIVPPQRISNKSALNNAYSKMTAGTLESLVMLGEGRETFAHIVSVFSRIIAIARNIRKGNFKNLAPNTYRRYTEAKRFKKSTATADFFGDAWLEARYAWRPLLIDAENAIKLYQSDHQLAPRETFRSGDVDSTSDVLDTVFLFDQGNVYRGSATIESQSKVRVGILAQATTSNGWTTELGLTNFGTAAWELIPFSFIVDWFVDVSGFFSKANISAAYKTLAVWSTFIETYTIKYTLDTFNSVPLSSPLQVEVVVERKTRVPGGEQSGPSINIGLDWPKVVDLIAIARNLT